MAEVIGVEVAEDDGGGSAGHGEPNPAELGDGAELEGWRSKP